MRAPEPALLLGLALLLDGTLREPPSLAHPVVWMGRAVAPLKRMRARGRGAELLIGALYSLSVVCGFALAASVGLSVLRPWWLLELTLGVYLLWSCFALAGLCAAGEEMALALELGDLARARLALSSLCSRDPSDLSATELAGASIESLTENTSDSVVAPLLYYGCVGVPGAVLYRAANTLDAMVGYRGRYEYLGKFAARLDDLLNLVPARLTALLLAIAGAALGLELRRGVTICLRDHACTESPNAGYPMAMAAGLLGVRLDKRGAYVLGRELGEPDVVALRRSIKLVRATGWLAGALLFATLLSRAALHG